MSAGIVEKALATEPERLLEDWGDVVDPREPFNDSPEFGLSPNVTYYSQLRDRADGRFLPVYDHEMDLRHIRAMAWLLSERVPMAQAWVNRLLDYTIGTGFDWTITHDNPQLQKECNRAIVDATDNSRWTSDLERESYTREIVDGEWLSELEVDSGQIRIVTREADELTEPANKPAVARWIADDESDFEKKSWTFGVLTNSKSTEIPIGYHFVRTVDGTDWDYCDASTVMHWKRNVRAKAKRGVSDFYKPHLYLMRADRVLTNTAEGAATQAAIAYIVEHPEKATQANVKAIAAKYAPETGRYDPKTGEAQRKRRMAPNTRIDTPAGAKYHASLMGGNSSNIYIAVMESALRLAGTVHAFPEGMLTGSYQNANYASSLTAESPFVQGRVAEQMHRAARVKEMFLKILKLACERGRFRHCGIEAWKDMAPGLNVEIQPAKVFPKNIKETTDALVIQKAQGWVDDKSAMTELGRDYDAVRLQQKLEKGQTPGEVDPNAPQQPETTADQPSGIYSQISRQQWIRNGKAIQDVVGNLVNGTTTPVLASVMLSTLGLDKETAQAIVDDVQSRGQESFQECLLEGGVGSGIKGHTTPRVRKWAAKRFKNPEHAKAFEKWFGDSKVVDERGDPLVVYHGSPEAFKQFDTTIDLEAARSKAAFFSDNPIVADGYANSQALEVKKVMGEISRVEKEKETLKLDMEMQHVSDRAMNNAINAALDDGSITKEQHEKWNELEDRLYDLERKQVKDETTPGIYPSYLSLKNPKVFDVKGGSWDYIVPHALKTTDRTIHDGIIFRNIDDNPSEWTNAGPSTTYAVFSSNKIKSATGNRGTFDPASNNINESEKNRRSILLDSREQRKQRKLIEGGKGSGITGHRTDRQKTARQATAKRSQPPQSDRVKRAQASKKIIGSDIQREADLKERAMAQKIKGISFKNSEPVDIVVGNSSGVVVHGIEHKYMVDNGNSKITMNKYAQVRKVNWERSNKAAFHTVVESREGDMYYRRGVGSFRIGGMHKLTGGHAELTKLLSTPDAALPAAARRTDGNIRVGVWKPTKDGPGFVNSKTGEVVRPKK